MTSVEIKIINELTQLEEIIPSLRSIVQSGLQIAISWKNNNLKYQKSVQLQRQQTQFNELLITNNVLIGDPLHEFIEQIQNEQLKVKLQSADLQMQKDGYQYLLLNTVNKSPLARLYNYKLGEIALKEDKPELVLQYMDNCLEATAEPQEQGYIYSLQGQAKIKQQQFDEGIAKIRLSCEILNDNIELLISSMILQAEFLTSKKNIVDAINIYLQVKNLVDIHSGGFKQKANIFYQLGSLYQSQKQYLIAINEYQQSLDYYQLEKFTNYDMPILQLESACLQQYGECLKFLKRDTEAMRYFQDAYEMKVKCYGIHHKQTLLTKIYTATTLFQIQDFDSSLMTFQEILQIQTQIIFSDEEVIGSTMNSIANVLLSMKRYQEAKEYSDKAVEKLTAKFGADHEIVNKAKSLNQKIAKNLK